jgi:hypothetical protein
MSRWPRLSVSRMQTSEVANSPQGYVFDWVISTPWWTGSDEGTWFGSSYLGGDMSVSPTAGWFPDPSGEVQERYWNGELWTRETRPYPPPAAVSSIPSEATAHSRDSSAWLPLFTDPLAVKAVAHREDSPPQLLAAVYSEVARLRDTGGRSPSFVDSVPHTLAALARNSNTSMELFAQLVGNGDPEGDWFQYQLAKESAFMPAMDTALMRRLVDQEGDDEVARGKVAANPNVPLDLMNRLATDSATYVRWSLAGNPNIAHELLMRFAHEGNPEVMGVSEDGDGGGASNPRIDISTLERLAAHPSEEVRASVTLNENTPSHILASLAQDSSPYVREILASSVRIPVEIMRSLVGDSSHDVVLSLSGNSHIPGDVVDAILRRSVDHYLDGNPATPVALLHTFLRTGQQDAFSQYVLLGNPSMDESTLRRYASHTEPLLRSAVASNTSTAPDVLELLSRDKDESVRYSVLVNPSYWPRP